MWDRAAPGGRTPCGGRARRPRPRPASCPGRPSSSNSRWSELPVSSSRTQLTGTRARRAARSSAPSTPGADRRHGRAQPERAVAADLVERQRPLQPALAAAGARPARQRERAEVVGRAGVDALLRAGGHQPDVAARRRAAQMRRPARASTPSPEALSLAPGAGGALSVWAIAMRRQLAGVSSTPITLRERPRPGTSKSCTATRRPARAEAARHQAVRAGLGGARRRSRAPRGDRAQRRREPTARRSARIASESSRSSSSRLGHRRLAGEALADVGGRAAVDGRAVGQQRHAVGGAAGHHQVRPEGAAHHALELARVVATSATSLHRRQLEVERLEQVPERLRVPGRQLVQQAQHAHGLVLVAVLAGQRAEPQQPVGGARVARRDRVVLQVLAARQQPLVVGRGLEEAAVAPRRRSARSSCRPARAPRRTSAGRSSTRRA